VARPPGQRVGGRDEVDGAAHEVGPHDASLGEQAGERVRVEAGEP
jgi:hypothetical protein